MNIEIIRTKYPKSFEKFTQWFKTQLVSSLGIPKEMVEQFTGETIDTFLPAIIQSRAPYDFFDSYQIHMFPMGSIEWKYRIVAPATNHDNSKNDEDYPTRRQAEDAGFGTCFTILEKKLS